MASFEHISLSDFIKSVHQKLRDEAAILGVEEAWQNHCKNDSKLNEYSKAMKTLATVHWENSGETKSVESRIDWVCGSCNEYFRHLNKYRAKEFDVLRKINSESETSVFLSLGDKIKLLDVGSCYNPFKNISEFDVTAIDIAPAVDEVLKCDFLNLRTKKDVIIDGKVEGILRASFDVVVFSLLLEYLPSPRQRLTCCSKAYELLKPEGILIIITPDSKHVGANAKIIKSWRFVLARMGFMRVKYEKLTYLHCMAFRKALFSKVAQRWAELHHNEELFDQIFIPQDFSHKTRIETDSSGVWWRDTFLEDLSENL